MGMNFLEDEVRVITVISKGSKNGCLLQNHTRSKPYTNKRGRGRRPMTLSHVNVMIANTNRSISIQLVSI